MKNEFNESICVEDMAKKLYGRKDREPVDTIITIKTILDDLGLYTTLVNPYKNENNWYSVTVIFNDFPDIYANGKGITEEFANASAYSELMERLQTGQLLDALFWRGSQQPAEEKALISTEILELFNDLFPKICRDMETADEGTLQSFLINNPRMKQLRPYHSYKQKKDVMIPHNFIYSIEGSNATCAGNTREEALTQGICELFERHVQKKLFYGKQDAALYPNIPLTYFEGMVSYELICSIIESGYSVIVKDLTLNGEFPVLGVFVLNKQKTRYFFSIGSDVDIDLCLQRCITEMFQGRDFNFSFREVMKPIFSADELGENGLTLKHNDLHYVTTLLNHSGMLPMYLLTQPHQPQNVNLKPFTKNRISNAEALDFVEKILLKHTSDIYVMDCSFLNFPAYRIYCPDFNDVHYYNLDVYMRSIGYEDKIKLNRQPMPKVFDENYLRYVSELGDIPRYVSFFPLHRYMGIALNRDSKVKYYDSIDEFCVKLSLKLSCYDIASKHLRKMRLSNPGRNVFLDLLLFCVEAKNNGIHDDELRSLLSIAHEPDYITKLFNTLYNAGDEKMILPNCPNCAHCDLREYCMYEKWKHIMEVLDQRRSK